MTNDEIEASVDEVKGYIETARCRASELGCEVSHKDELVNQQYFDDTQDGLDRDLICAREELDTMLEMLYREESTMSLYGFVCFMIGFFLCALIMWLGA